MFFFSFNNFKNISFFVLSFLLIVFFFPNKTESNTESKNPVISIKNMSCHLGNVDFEIHNSSKLSIFSCFNKGNLEKCEKIDGEGVIHKQATLKENISVYFLKNDSYLIDYFVNSDNKGFLFDNLKAWFISNNIYPLTYFIEADHCGYSVKN
jgi:hypothetical protein